MANTVYILCAVTSISCAILLLRSYRTSHVRMLLWSGLCFTFLALNNILLVLDLTVLTEVDLSTVRVLPEVIGLALLLYGFIWDKQSHE
ncbi:MAG TPA: DUF5985 family protein [Candidatus Kapabacteria bacterium]|jgi:hypothetical protein|nr:DUF5985 family protein [Candidatus Kapabacteria bacterium]